eukprot:gene19622-24042_t
MLNDVARAIRLVRTFAKRDGLDPARVGVIGSSAGGHLASTIATHSDAGQADAADLVERESSRPDIAILCYPVISLGDFGHAGSRKNLLGDKPDPALVRLLSNELQVTAQTTPSFIWHTVEDKTVPVENAHLFAAALRAVLCLLLLTSSAAHALTCSPYKGQAFINELRVGASGFTDLKNQIEVYN